MSVGDTLTTAHAHAARAAGELSAMLARRRMSPSALQLCERELSAALADTSSALTQLGHSTSVGVSTLKGDERDGPKDA